MSKLKTLVITLLFPIYLVGNEAPVLSDQASISLLTCSPGEELYSLFGHSAFRVHDPKNKIDVVFNYGTFTFDENFYYNFTMGKLNYKLSISSMESFKRSYAYEDRGIKEQVLALDSMQKQAVFDFLNWNYLPENRYYLYDFFYDNCSSRLRDVLEKSLTSSKLVFKDILYPSRPSFRNMIDSYLIYHPWGDFGIDLGLGLPCDVVPSAYEYMFLPDELYRAFNHASIDGHPLVKEEHSILESSGLTAEYSLTQPIPLMWLFFGLIAIISAIGYRVNRLLRVVDVIYLLITGAVGALVFFLWFITDHTGTMNNLNILWAWPINLFVIPFIFFKRPRQLFWKAYGIVMALTLFGFAFLPQDLHFATIPIILAGLVRALLNVSYSGKENF